MSNFPSDFPGAMSAYVRMAATDKRRLIALQAEVTKRRGTRISQGALLGELIQLARTDFDAFAARLEG